MDEKTEAELLERARTLQAAAQVAALGHPCPIGGEYPFWMPAPRALIEGHIYSRAGMREHEMNGCCEYHFDKAFDVPDYPGSKDVEALAELTGGQRHVLYNAFELSRDYDGEAYPRGECNSVADANLISSELAERRGWHTVMIDLDVDARLIPSSTPGHSHLFVNVPMPWEKYVRLLVVLEDCGLIEFGYLSASLERQATHLRLPWIKKQINPEVQDG